MSFKKRNIQLTTDASGDAEGTLGLGAAYGKVIGVWYDASTSSWATGGDLTVVDADGRAVWSDTDIGTSDIDHPLSQTAFSYAGVALTTAGDGPKVFKSPLTVTLAQGGNAQTGNINFFVEV